MPENIEVAVGDVARQAIERLQDRFKTLQLTMGEISRVSADLQDQLRELLSYCESRNAEAATGSEAAYAYGEIADKLRGILDGE